MKSTINRFFATAGFALLLLATIGTNKAAAQDVVVSYQSFYDELSPYGQWVFDAEYGNVWVPNEEPGYRPYATRGHWVMTDYGNMWVSDAPWGWACYHYGRWTYNPFYGWVWIPGHEWAPAWVSWRSGGGYYGWAPMGPGYNPGGTYYYPDNYWVFVTPQYLYHPNVYSYYDSRNSYTYMRQTTYINETYVDNARHTTYYYGPRQQEIERETRQPVQVYRISEAREPGAGSTSGNNVSIYRPAVNRQSYETARPANVYRATQAIGKPQEIAPTQNTTQPAFRTVMQQQNPAFKSPNNYNNNAGNSGVRSNPSTTQPSTPTARPGAQHFERVQDEQPHSQPVRNQDQQRSVPQNERTYNQEPQRGQGARPGTQEAPSRQQEPSRQQQGRPQGTPQPQPQPQHGNPAPSREHKK